MDSLKIYVLRIKVNISLSSFDIVLTNPSFGSKIKVEGTSILDQYDLAHAWGREIIRRDLYENYASTNIVDFAPIVETNGRIIDDVLPEIARLSVEEYKD